MRYEAVFTMDELTGTKKEQSEKSKPKQADEIVDKKGVDVKTIAKGLTIVTTGVAVASQLYQRYESVNNAISGDGISQARLNNQMAYLNEGLGIAGTIGIAAIVNPELLPVVLIGLGVKYSMKAYQVAQENRLKTATWQSESIINNEKQKRLVQDITGVRI